jgi:hypothetical protein
VTSVAVVIEKFVVIQRTPARKNVISFFEWSVTSSFLLALGTKSPWASFCASEQWRRGTEERTQYYDIRVAGGSSDSSEPLFNQSASEEKEWS